MSKIYPFFLDYGVKATKFGAFKFNDEFYVFLPIEIENVNFPNISFTTIEPEKPESTEETQDVKKNWTAFQKDLAFQPTDKKKKKIFILNNINTKLIDQFMKPLNFSIFDIYSDKYPKLLKFERVIEKLDDDQLKNRIPAFYSMGHVNKLFSRGPTDLRSSNGKDNDFSLITMYLLKVVQYDLPPPLYQNPDPRTNRGRYAIEYYDQNYPLQPNTLQYCKHVFVDSDFYELCPTQPRQTFQIDADSNEIMNLYLVDISKTDKDEIIQTATTPFFDNAEKPTHDLAFSTEFKRAIRFTSILNNGRIYIQRDAKFPVHFVIRSNMPILISMSSIVEMTTHEQ